MKKFAISIVLLLMLAVLSRIHLENKRVGAGRTVLHL